MRFGRVRMWGFRCGRCGHEWKPRDKIVSKTCPKCKSPYWNKPRKNQKTKEKQASPPSFWYNGDPIGMGGD